MIAATAVREMWTSFGVMPAIDGLLWATSATPFRLPASMIFQPRSSWEIVAWCRDIPGTVSGKTTLQSGDRPNVAVLRTLSKAGGLAGLRAYLRERRNDCAYMGDAYAELTGALEYFVLRGGKAIVFVDPYSELAARAERPAANRCGTVGPITMGPSPKH